MKICIAQIESLKGNVQKNIQTHLQLIEHAINLNSDLSVSSSKGGSGPVWSDKWKVLIYDKASKSTVAPLLSVQRLRQLGITVYMMVDTPRQKIPDVPAVYFLKPTLENVQIVANDCNNHLYQPFPKSSKNDSKLHWIPWCFWRPHIKY